MKVTKKHRKWTRNSAFCLGYKNNHQREKNKIVHLEKHLKLFPNDVGAKQALDELKKLV